MQVETAPFLDHPALVGRGIHGWPMGLEDRTHFHELDALGHVNNIAYLQWLENARIIWFMHHGLTQYRTGDVRLVIRSQSITYHREMGLGIPYIVALRAAALRTTSFTLTYGVFAQGEMTAEGHSVVVQLSPDGRAKQPLSPAIRAKIEDEATRFPS